MYVFRELTDLSYPGIARIFGGRDHTTVIHAVEKIQRLMSERKQIYDQVTDLHAAAEVMTRADVSGRTPCGQRVDSRRSMRGQPRVVHRTHTSSFATWGRRWTTRRGDTHPLRCGDDGLSPIHSTYYCYHLDPTPRCGKGRICEVPMRA